MVREGAWLATFTGPSGSGGSALMLKAGRIRGETEAYRYSGTYKVQHNTFFASMTVQEVIPMNDNFAGIEGDFELEIVGFFKEGGAQIEATGFVKGNRDIPFEIVLSNVSGNAL